MHFYCFPGFHFFHGFYFPEVLIWIVIAGVILRWALEGHDHHAAAPQQGPPPGGYCPTCGAPFREQAGFCAHCGAKRS